MTSTSEASDAGSFDQRRIWEHAQNVEPEKFQSARPRLDFLLKQIARRSKGRVPAVLNIGVGDGYFERQAKCRGWKIHSLDPDQASMDRLAKEGIASHVGMIESMPLEDGLFDFVVASEVLEHLTDEQRTAGCGEIARVLRPGGWFLGTVPFREDLSLRQCLCPDCGLTFHQFGHLAAFDFSDVDTMLGKQFVVVTLGRSAFVSFQSRGIAGKLKSAFRMVLGRLGNQIAVPRLFWISRKRG